MKKIALINQRYGQEVNGGSEYYTRLLAKELTDFYNVDILTTMALSYDTWQNYYNESEEIAGEIHIRRFPVLKKRGVLKQKICAKLINVCGLNCNIINRGWINAQGPYAPDLVEYISEHAEEYDTFIFVTYLYYTTVYGMPKVRSKSVFIPTAHDEYYIYFKIYKDLFHMPKAIIYLTEEEKKFVHTAFHNEDIPYCIAGIGIDLPVNIEAERFRGKYDINSQFLLYMGRVDIDKGCDEMISFFIRFRKQYKEMELVIMGQSFMDIPEAEGIRYLGFVSEEDKFDGISAAKAIWLPSRFESLSISLLEAMALEKPVVVNGYSEVLKGHCTKSGGGIHYTRYEEFEAGLQRICGEDYENMCVNAVKYVRANYGWNRIMGKIKEMIDYPERKCSKEIR